MCAIPTFDFPNSNKQINTNLMKTQAHFFLVTALLLIAEHVNAQITFQERLGTMHSEAGFRVAPLSDSGFMIFAHVNTDTLSLIRADKWGNARWVKKYWLNSQLGSASFKKLSDGNFLISGNYNTRLSLFKVNDSGNVIWSKSYAFPGGASSRGIQETNDHGFIVPFFDGFSNPDSYRLMKTDSAGNVDWCKSYHVDSLNLLCMAVEQIEDGGYLFLGTNLDYLGFVYINFSIKLDANGNILHANQFDDLSLKFENHLQHLNNNSFLLACGSQMFCFDSTASLVWEKGFIDYNISIESSLLINQNKIALAGYCPDSSGNTDAIFIEVDSSGNVLNSKKFGSTFRDYSLGFCLAADSGFCHVGRTESFGADSVDIYMVKTDSNGNSGCNEISYLPAIYSVTNNVFSPFSMNVTNLNPSINSDTLYSESISLTQNIICSINTSIGIGPIIDSRLIIYPNPAYNNFIVKINSEISNGALEIFNTYGKRIYSTIFNEEKIIYENFPSGIYFVKVTDGEKQFVAKLIVQ